MTGRPAKAIHKYTGRGRRSAIHPFVAVMEALAGIAKLVAIGNDKERRSIVRFQVVLLTEGLSCRGMR